jgi:hypothetical protein
MDIDEAITAGFSAHISKPLTFDSLVDKVHQLVDRKDGEADSNLQLAGPSKE